MGRTTSNITCPTCHAAKVRLATRKGLSDSLLGGFTIYPFRCQLCADRFRKFLGRRTLNPRRSFDRVVVLFPVWFRPHRTPGSPRVGQEGVIENLSIRGCRIRTTAPIIIGSPWNWNFSIPRIRSQLRLRRRWFVPREGMVPSACGSPGSIEERSDGFGTSLMCGCPNSCRHACNCDCLTTTSVSVIPAEARPRAVALESDRC